MSLVLRGLGAPSILSSWRSVHRADALPCYASLVCARADRKPSLSRCRIMGLVAGFSLPVEQHRCCSRTIMPPFAFCVRVTQR